MVFYYIGGTLVIATAWILIGNKFLIPTIKQLFKKEQPPSAE
jgi:hypothetical protein